MLTSFQFCELNAKHCRQRAGVERNLQTRVTRPKAQRETAMAKVYFYKLPNPDTGEMMMPPLKATRELVERYGGLLMLETEEDVADDDLDRDGHYDPALGDAVDDAINEDAVS